MYLRRSSILLALASLVLAVTGCQTVESRIREKPEVFAQADAATREKIQQGLVGLGYTEDMVYLALGKPDETREKVTASGRTVVWIYNTYFTRYDDAALLGYSRRVYFDPYLRAYRVVHAPVFVEAYTDKEERIRITFADGKVTTIEEART